MSHIEIMKFCQNHWSLLGRPEERLGRLNQRILSENQLNSPRLTQERSIFPSFENLKVIHVWTKLFLAGNLLNYSRPGRVWLVTSRLGTGKTITFFTVCEFTCRNSAFEMES